MGRVNSTYLAWGAGSALMLCLLRIVTAEVSFNTTHQIVIDPQLAASYQEELALLIQRLVDKSPQELHTLARSAVPPIEKVGKRQRAQGIIECLIIAETPKARIIAHDEPFILTAQGACSPDFYAESAAYQGLPTIIVPEELTGKQIERLRVFADNQKKYQSPVDQYLWKKPTALEMTIAGKPVIITESTPVTPEFVSFCEKIIAEHPKRAVRIDGRFDRMIILRGKEHP